MTQWSIFFLFSHGTSTKEAQDVHLKSDDETCQSDAMEFLSLSLVLVKPCYESFHLQIVQKNIIFQWIEKQQIVSMIAWAILQCERQPFIHGAYNANKTLIFIAWLKFIG